MKTVDGHDIVLHEPVLAISPRTRSVVKVTPVEHPKGGVWFRGECEEQMEPEPAPKRTVTYSFDRRMCFRDPALADAVLHIALTAIKFELENEREATSRSIYQIRLSLGEVL